MSRLFFILALFEFVGCRFAAAAGVSEKLVWVRVQGGQVLSFVARPIFGDPQEAGERYPSVYSENCRVRCAALDRARQARAEMVSARDQAGGVSPFEVICRKLKGVESWGQQLPEEEGPAESFCYFKDSHHPQMNSYINTAELWRLALRNSRHLP